MLDYYLPVLLKNCTLLRKTVVKLYNKSKGIVLRITTPLDYIINWLLLTPRKNLFPTMKSEKQ